MNLSCASQNTIKSTVLPSTNVVRVCQSHKQRFSDSRWKEIRQARRNIRDLRRRNAAAIDSSMDFDCLLMRAEKDVKACWTSDCDPRPARSNCGFECAFNLYRTGSQCPQKRLPRVASRDRTLSRPPEKVKVRTHV
jgi:hypothetical protein